MPVAELRAWAAALGGAVAARVGLLLERLGAAPAAPLPGSPPTDR